MYDSIVSVQHSTSISYNTNTGKILCIAPDDLFDLWSLSSCLINIITLISTFVSFTSVDYINKLIVIVIAYSL